MTTLITTLINNKQMSTIHIIVTFQNTQDKAAKDFLSGRGCACPTREPDLPSMTPKLERNRYANLMALKDQNKFRENSVAVNFSINYKNRRNIFSNIEVLKSVVLHVPFSWGQNSSNTGVFRNRETESRCLEIENE